jgi:hypothetical protein
LGSDRHFAITGAMVIAAAIGIGRALAPKSHALIFFSSAMACA